MLTDREDITEGQNVFLQKKLSQKEGYTIPHRHEIYVDKNQTSESAVKLYINSENRLILLYAVGTSCFLHGAKPIYKLGQPIQDFMTKSTGPF